MFLYAWHIRRASLIRSLAAFAPTKYRQGVGYLFRGESTQKRLFRKSRILVPDGNSRHQDPLSYMLATTLPPYEHIDPIDGTPTP